MSVLNRNVVIFGSVVLLHLAALWALHTGLLRRAVEVLVPVQLLAEIVEPPRPAPPPVIVPRSDVPKAAAARANADLGLLDSRVVPARDPERDVLTALERWVEKGIAPERLIGTGTAPATPSKPLTRPICPHPRVSRYKGTGEPNDAANFSCAAP